MTVDFSNLDASNVKKLKDFMSRLSENVNTLKIVHFNTPKLLSTRNMFRINKYLKVIDLGILNTSNWSNADRMFGDCRQLETIIFKATESWRLLSVYEMFSGCNALRNVNLPDMIPDGSSIETMGYMFACCRNLKYLDFSTFNITGDTSLDRAFCDCPELYGNMDYIKMPSNSQSADLIMGQLLGDDWNKE